jgi:hypothetical protein
MNAFSSIAIWQSSILMSIICPRPLLSLSFNAARMPIAV